MDDDPNYDLSISVPDRGPSGPPTRQAPSNDRHLQTRPGWTRIKRSVQAAVAESLRRHRVVSARIHIAIVTDPEIARLNAEFLGQGSPTDVLSFDLTDQHDGAIHGAAESDGKAPAHAHVEGDLVISMDTAAREAEARGHDVAAELALYAVHGVLHLIGYDDATAADARRMHDLEDDILSAAEIGPVYDAVRRDEVLCQPPRQMLRDEGHIEAAVRGGPADVPPPGVS